MKDTIWIYALDEDAENWSGRCATREEAVKEARLEYGPNEPFWVAEAVRRGREASRARRAMVTGGVEK